MGSGTIAGETRKALQCWEGVWRDTTGKAQGATMLCTKDVMRHHGMRIFSPTPATYLGENSRIRRVFKAGDAVQRGPFQGNRPRYFARKVDVLPLEERRGFVNVSFD